MCGIPIPKLFDRVKFLLDRLPDFKYMQYTYALEVHGITTGSLPIIASIVNNNRYIVSYESHLKEFGSEEEAYQHILFYLYRLAGKQLN